MAESESIAGTLRGPPVVTPVLVLANVWRFCAGGAVLTVVRVTTEERSVCQLLAAPLEVGEGGGGEPSLCLCICCCPCPLTSRV